MLGWPSILVYPINWLRVILALHGMTQPRKGRMGRVEVGLLETLREGVEQRLRNHLFMPRRVL